MRTISLGVARKSVCLTTCLNLRRANPFLLMHKTLQMRWSETEGKPPRAADSTTRLGDRAKDAGGHGCGRRALHQQNLNFLAQSVGGYKLESHKLNGRFDSYTRRNCRVRPKVGQLHWSNQTPPATRARPLSAASAGEFPRVFRTKLVIPFLTPCL